MVGILDYIKDGDLLNWQKFGYGRNIRGGIPIAPDANLIPFFWPVGETGIGLRISTFELLQVDKTGTCATYDIGITNIGITDNGNKEIIVYPGNQGILSGIAEYYRGTYQYKITFISGAVFYSEVFYIDSQKFLGTSGDFNNDFNDDFYI